MSDQVEEQPINDSEVVALLIGAESALLKDRLAAIARKVVDRAVKSGGHASVADVVSALESCAEEMGVAIDQEIVAAIDGIAERAVAVAETSIIDARAESDRPFPEPESGDRPDYKSWSRTTAASIVASLTAMAKDAGGVESIAATDLGGQVEVVVESVTGSDLSGHIEGLASTASGRAVNDARLATFQANDDIVTRLLFSTVNDSKTSSVCRKLAGVSFNVKAKKVPRPPLHVGCRSHLTPVTVRKKKRLGKPRDQMNEAEKAAQDLAIYRSQERSEKKRKAREEAERMIEAQRKKEGEERSVAEVLELRFAPSEIDGSGTFSGIASAYGVLDAHGTEFRAGAFSESLAERRTSGQRIPILLHHDPRRVAGIVTDVADTPQGLLIEGRFVTDTTDGREGYALAKAGGMALSVGFRRLADLPRSGGGRTITKASLAEISLVSVASNPRTKITEVRSAPDAENTVINGENHMSLNETAPENNVDPAPEIRALASRLDKLEARSARAGLGGVETRGEGDIETRAFTSFIRSGKEGMGADEVRSLRASDAATGGVLVPSGFRAELLKLLVELSPIRSLATVTPTSSGDLVLPKQTGKPTAAWVSEIATRTSTEPAFGQANIPVHEAAVYVDISQRLIDDSAINVETELAAMLASEYARLEGAAFLLGDGTGKPRGIMAHPDFDTLANGHATNLSADAIIKLMHSLPATYRNKGAWLMNGTTLGKIRTLKDGQGNYLWRPSLAEGNPETILGRPVYECVDMADVASGAVPIVFGDIGTAYRIADRLSGMSLLRDPYSVATSGLVRFHSRIRVGGDLVRPEAVKGLEMAV